MSAAGDTAASGDTMQAVVMSGYARGTPWEVVDATPMPKPTPGAGQVLCQVLLATINPSDINVLEGVYLHLPANPSGHIPGFEAVARVVQLGEGVTQVAVGDVVVSRAMWNSAWGEFAVGDAAALLVLPSSVPLEQAAQLCVNPPTAYAMLLHFHDLKPGDWVVQNAANSAVGRSVIEIAHHWGVHTVNVVRRAELCAELKAIGADVVVTDDEPLAPRIHELTGGAPVRLALNCVGGKSAKDLAKCLAPESTLVTYGAMAREPITISNSLLIFKGITFAGFHVGRWMRKVGEARTAQMWSELVDLAAKRVLRSPVQDVFAIADVKDAIRTAYADKRKGKVLLRMAE